MTSIGPLSCVRYLRGNEAGSSQEAEYSGYSECDLLLDCCRLSLVFRAVPSRHLAPPQEIPTEDMTLIHAAIVFVSLAAFSFAAVSLGNLILRIWHLEMDTDTLHLLICARVGVISVEILLFGVEVTQQIRKGCFVVMGLLCIFLIAEFELTAQRNVRILKALFSSRGADRLLTNGIVLGVEFLASLEPLTGSDALSRNDRGSAHGNGSERGSCSRELTQIQKICILSELPTGGALTISRE